jgi:hypothetical protein
MPFNINNLFADNIIDPAIKHLNMSFEHKQPWDA